VRTRMRGQEAGFKVLAGFGAALGFLALLGLIAVVLLDGVGNLSVHFFSNFASRFPGRAGIRVPLFGTLWLLGLTAVISVPISVGAAIYLKEFAPRTWVTRAVQANIANLAGIPSVVYGILGLAFFVEALGLGRSVLAGALTLALLIAPLIILSTQAALGSVPESVTDEAYGLGATRWQVVRFQVLPRAFPGIVSGALMALSRAVGETAPLVMIGAVTFITFTPRTVTDPFTALPVQVFHWVARSQDDFQGLAAAAIIVLLAITLGLNALAVILRNRLEKR